MSRRKHDGWKQHRNAVRLHDGSIDDEASDDGAFDDEPFDDGAPDGADADGQGPDGAPPDSPATASDPRTSVDDLWRMAEQPHLRAWIVANTSAPADLINEIARVGGPGVHRALAILRESLAAPGSAT